MAQIDRQTGMRDLAQRVESVKMKKEKKGNYEKMNTFVFSKLSPKNATYRRHQSVTNTFF